MSPGCVAQEAWGCDAGEAAPRAPQAPSPARQQAHLFLTLRCEAGKLSWSAFGCLGPSVAASDAAGWAFADSCRDVDPGGCQQPCDMLSVGTNPRSCRWIPGLCQFRRCRGRGARCSPMGLGVQQAVLGAAR